MKVLITGGTGMLGTNLQVAFGEYENEAHFVGRGNYHDLRNVTEAYGLIYDYKPDVVIHCAANVGGIRFNQENPVALMKDNLEIGMNILGACNFHKVQRLYMVSTCCAYPKMCPVPFKEDDLWNGFPDPSNAPYGIAKKTIMALADAYRQQYGLKTTHFILANLYGKFDHFDGDNNHVIPALIAKFLKAKQNSQSVIKLWGTGKATRDFFFAADCAQALYKAVNKEFDSDKPINLGSNQEVSIKELAETIKRLVGFEGEIVFTGEVGNGQPRRLLDTTRAKTLLNWQSTTKLEDGLKQTIDWYINHHKSAS